MPAINLPIDPRLYLDLTKAYLMGLGIQPVYIGNDVLIEFIAPTVLSNALIVVGIKKDDVLLARRSDQAVPGSLALPEISIANQISDPGKFSVWFSTHFAPDVEQLRPLEGVCTLDIEIISEHGLVGEQRQTYVDGLVEILPMPAGLSLVELPPSPPISGDINVTTTVTLGLFDCLSSLVVGDCVYIDANDHVAAALATSETTKAIGLVSQKPTSTTAIVVEAGVLNAFAGLVAGVDYYLSSTLLGKITSTPPSASGEIVQRIGMARNATTLLIDVDATVVEL